MGFNDNPQFLYLTTKGWKTGKQHKIEIWFVEYDKRYYVMSENMDRADWVKNISMILGFWLRLSMIHSTVLQE